MKYKFILFDLDGTLTNPQEGICKSINYALNYFGTQRPLESLTKYIGPPLLPTFTELLDEEKAPLAIAKYRERYSVVGLFENEIYPHVKETLSILQQKGFVLCTASSKPQPYVQRILEHFDIDKYFAVIGGASLDGKISEKEDVIDHVLKQINAEKKDVVMVGDTRFDLIGAEKMGMDAIAVTYGFGSKEELAAYCPVGIIEDISQIIDVLE